MTKNILFCILVLLAGISLFTNYFFSSNSEIVSAQKAAEDAQVMVESAEEKLDEIQASYESVIDSMSQRQDSLKEVSLQASISAAQLQVRLATRSHSLADSLTQAGEGQMASIVRELQATHDSVVVELNTQIDVLKDERAMLWRRVEVSDSLIGVQEEVNHALRASVAALTDERDAWKAKANPPLLTRLYRNSPALLTGAVLGVALTSR